jgi:hypothetical protein
VIPPLSTGKLRLSAAGTYLRERKARTELAQVNREPKLLRAQLVTFEERQAVGPLNPRGPTRWYSTRSDKEPGVAPHKATLYPKVSTKNQVLHTVAYTLYGEGRSRSSGWRSA